MMRTTGETGRAVENSDLLNIFARIGFTAKGVVYVLIGVLAIQAALGRRGETEGSQGAVSSLADEPLSFVILILLAIGLAAYVLWRFATAILDTENAGSDAGGILKRIGYFISALSYGALTVLAIQLAAGRSGGGDGETREEWTARLMATDYGTWILGLIGLAIIGVGTYQVYKGLGTAFMDRYRAEGMSTANRKWAKRAGRIGHVARGVTFGIIGILLIRAAVESDPDDAKGIGGALATLAEQPYGRWLLLAVAVGFVAYGIYCFLRARYRRFEL